MKKNDTWNIRRLVDESFGIDPAYYIEDWLILILIWSSKIWGTMASQAPPWIQQLYTFSRKRLTNDIRCRLCGLADWLVSTSLNVSHASERSSFCTLIYLIVLGAIIDTTQTAKLFWILQWITVLALKVKPPHGCSWRVPMIKGISANTVTTVRWWA